MYYVGICPCVCMCVFGDISRATEIRKHACDPATIFLDFAYLVEVQASPIFRTGVGGRYLIS